MTDPFEIAGDMLTADCTGDEKLWVFRYMRALKGLTGWAQTEVWEEAQAAYGAWGNDLSCTPEEIAESDAHCAREDAA